MLCTSTLVRLRLSNTLAMALALASLGGCSADDSGGGGSAGSPSIGGATSTAGSGGVTATAGAAGAPVTSGGSTGSGGASSTAGAATTGGASGGGGGGAGGSSGGSGGASGGAAGAAGGGMAGAAGGPTDGYPLGNPAVPSAGCTKTTSVLKNGTFKLTSAGLDREYIVSLPTGYDQKKPYRVVFGMHWLGGSMNAVNNDGWFRLKKLDTQNSTIWVAPQGYTDASPWRGGDNKDHVFFEELVKLVEAELCVDTSRIFSVGFSFGAMYSNSLAQTHQDILRGVVVYATADYNIYFPTNTGKPLAYMGVHGSADGTCPITSGRKSKDRFVKNNGCTEPASVPEATGNTHVSFDYQCKSNYPVKWTTHVGGHTDQPKDPGQGDSWVMAESWKFITQF